MVQRRREGGEDGDGDGDGTSGRLPPMRRPENTPGRFWDMTRRWRREAKTDDSRTLSRVGRTGLEQRMTKRERKSSCDVRFGQISNRWSRYQDAWNENVGRRILSGGAVEVDWKKTLEQTGR